MTMDTGTGRTAHHSHLERLPLFAGLSADDIAHLANAAQHRHITAGELVMEEGCRGDGLHVVIRGELAVTRRDGAGEILLALVGPGTFVGEMSLVDDAPRSASVRARTESEVLVIAPADFRRLIATTPSAALTIMRTIMGRLRSTESALQQQARMASLGTLAAGLAHELNNPASAVHSGIGHLRRAFSRWEGESAPVHPQEWQTSRAEVMSLLDEIALAADAITGIVRAVKGHAYLGEAPAGPVDVVRSLADALTVMRGKLRDRIRVIREVDPHLPVVEGHGAELGQLWTNLIDNAVDAVNGEGTLEVRARAEGDVVVVELSDSGPGIPEEIRHRIFDPFFTTKPPGAGTGLGLHIAYTIVRKHGGRISVASRPGRTTFRVELPVRDGRTDSLHFLTGAP